ncbi:hypothetical protein [Vulcanisaeta sp. JCM 16161]|uniref:hypothetical protein n=1 Tax=Vulcanisaeta sp. JCM 16161 TaxID=1295372 RepID=UPI000A4F4DCA|nr:hypothetical protein [Vulcanisaeta sp. JCM 16161]
MKLIKRDCLGKLEREVKELGSIKLRMVRVKPVKGDDKELIKFVNSWSMRCAEPLRSYCRSVLSSLSSTSRQDQSMSCSVRCWVGA